MNPHVNNLFHKYNRTLFLFSSTILLIFSSCQQKDSSKTAPADISQEERLWLTQFFSDLMFFENGIYTLWGASKPMTIVQVDHYSEEEMKSHYDSLTDDQKKNGCIFEDYSFPETWEKWEKIQDRFPMNRFMLFKMDQLRDENTFFVLLVDVLKVANVIRENYDAFHKAIGFDFHPVEITLEMNQKDSVLMQALTGNNSHLFGLLFGYGKENSYFFQWKNFDHPKSCEKFCEKIRINPSHNLFKGRIKLSIDNFYVPTFMSFNEIDPVIETYKQERQQIKEIYKGHDFLDTTLRRILE